MKSSLKKAILIPITWYSLCIICHAQVNSGSNGSYGPLDIKENTTLVVPEDGVFHCTTINIAFRTTLRFTKNSLNTPVYLLATGDIIIGDGPQFNEANPEAVIDISGENPIGEAGGTGGPGGFDGGRGGLQPGDGLGPGGGKAGWSTLVVAGKPADIQMRGSAGFATICVSSDQVRTRGERYGNSLMIPPLGGSGGGGGIKVNTGSNPGSSGSGGGGGGGVMIIASKTKIKVGRSGYYPAILRSRGGNADPFQNRFGNGSGGAFRLTAPVIEGYLKTEVSSTTSGAEGDNYTGSGRIRIDTYNKNLMYVGSPNVTTGTNMSISPENFPEIRILEVGMEAIPPEQKAAALVLLPAGSASTQKIKVSVKNFKTVVPLRIVITPDSGPKISTDFEIDNLGDGSTEGTVNVDIPVGVSNRIDVWTR